MPKLRFSTDAPGYFSGQKKVTYFALNTEEVTAWTLNNGDEAIELWLRGAGNSLYLDKQHLGDENFNALLAILNRQFPLLEA